MLVPPYDPPCLEDADPPTYWWHDVGKLLEASVFEGEYADKSKVGVAYLHRWGRFPEPCDCGYVKGAHWRMGYQFEDAIIMDMITSLPPNERLEW
jgi:hypothetical protein